jgi:hypothetical protein
MTCEYPTRKAQHGELNLCGKPATHQATKGSRLCYCDDHTAVVRRNIEVKPIKATQGQTT